MLEFEPAGTDPERGAAVGGVVERGDGLGQQRGVPVRVSPLIG